MREIPLTQGKVALIDDEDYEEVMKYRWCAVLSRSGVTYYAIAHLGRGRKDRRMVKMHQVVMGPGETGLQIDHKNRDGLDNRRANLRWATRSQQRWNQGVRRDSMTGFKGVNLIRGRWWSATIRAHGKPIYLGYFPTAEDAARAYDAKARELHGEFAYVNFPDTRSTHVEDATR